MAMLMKSVQVPLADVYVPARFRATLDPKKVETLAASISETGQKTAIQVRRDKERYVLVTGVHRLEALRLLGGATVEALIVQVRPR